MKLLRIVPMLAIPVLAVGCSAGAADDGADGSEAAATSSASVEFTAAVGVVELEGKQVCTAAVVDVEASASVGPFSASGRQVVLGQACVGALAQAARGAFVGGAVFVTHVGDKVIRVPIVAIEAGADAARFAVGILHKSITDIDAAIKPLKPFQGWGANAGVQGRGNAITLLRADSHGVQVGAAAEAAAGAEFGLRTTCTDWRWRAQSQAGAGVAAEAGEVLGAAAIARVNGELQFAGSIDTGCVAAKVSDHIDALRTLIRIPLQAASSVLDAAASIGQGTVIAVYSLTDRVTTVRVYFYEAASEIRFNARGRLSAQIAGGASCSGLIGACTLAGSFQAGAFVDVQIDTGLNLFGGASTAVTVSVD